LGWNHPGVVNVKDRPYAAKGGDFNDPTRPRPAIQTAATAEGETWLAFFSVFMPREDVKAASMQ
jgi:hypothetical protein